MWEYNGAEYELNVYDATTMDRYEKAFTEMQTKAQALKPSESMGENIRAQCAIFREAFDEVFGENVGAAITGGKDDLLVCMDAAESLIRHVTDQGRAMNRFIDKFAPRKRK